MLKQYPYLSTIICAASGPSLTEEDCDLVSSLGLPVVAVNNTWSRFPDLLALYAGDLSWWNVHHASVPKKRFRLVTASAEACKKFPGIEYRRYCENGEGYNSGANAIEFAASLGATRVILIGYDCSVKQGVHWHGKHEGGLRNPSEKILNKWQNEFLRAKRNWPNVEIINCSRRTELKCFPLKNLEQVIASSSLRQGRVLSRLKVKDSSHPAVFLQLR